MMVWLDTLSYNGKDYFPVSSHLFVSFVYVFIAEVVEIMEPIVEIYIDHLLFAYEKHAKQ